MYLPVRVTRLAASFPLSRTLGTWSKHDSIATSATDISERKIHLTSSQDYPQVAPLPLPANIDPNETITFSPERARDISSTEMQCHAAMSTSTYPIDVTCDQNAVDPHVHSYDCHGSVHLNTMQSNVPQPFSSGAQFRNHLNMSGGQWAQNGKFMSQHLQASHYTNLRQQVRLDWDKKGAFMPNRSFHCLIAARTSTNPDQYRQLMSQIQVMRGAYSTANGPTAPSQSGETNDEKKSPPKTESKQSKLKQAVKEYGATVLIFHISLSLASLGTFYALVSSGLDVVAVLNYFNLNDSIMASKVGAGASTFVVAYAVHKVFAPVRISITLGATPFIVKALRKRGIIKPPRN